jgi:hypothetical protein
VSWNDLHSRAERLATAAELAVRSGNDADAAALYEQAAALETDALDALGSEKPRTRGITAVSAVALWYKARKYREAERLAHVGLSSQTLPPFATEQLQYLLQMLWAAGAAEKAGRRFVAGDVLVSVAGGVVLPGGAPLDLIQQKIEGIQAVLFRVAEMLVGAPLRRRGGPSAELQQAFRPWLFQAPAGSYQFAVRVEQPPQMHLFVSQPSAEQVTERFFSILRASAKNPDTDLPALVPDRGYREAFVNLSRNLAPTGKAFARLEVRDASAPAVEPIVLEESSRRALNGTLKALKSPPSQVALGPVVELRGILRGLHLDQDWLEVLLDRGESNKGEAPKSVRIEAAGEVLDDVIGPMVNHRVVVTATRRGEKLRFEDIEPEE